MTDDVITAARIEELLRFLPRLTQGGANLEPTWPGLDRQSANGVIHAPYPVYPEVVEEFFRLAAQEWWCDYDYDPVTTGDMLRDDRRVADASLAEVKSMLTFCVRGERFCAGVGERSSGPVG